MKIGSQEAMPPLERKPRRLSPQPYWKVATRTPQAAPARLGEGREPELLGARV
jgi:hypothetical protein